MLLDLPAMYTVTVFTKVYCYCHFQGFTFITLSLFCVHCSARINQSISLLDSLDSDSMRTKIVTEVQTWRSKTFNSINKYISTFKEELHAHPATKVRALLDIGLLFYSV